MEASDQSKKNQGLAPLGNAGVAGTEVNATIKGDALHYLEIRIGDRGTVTSLMRPADAEVLATIINSHKVLVESLQGMIADYWKDTTNHTRAEVREKYPMSPVVRAEKAIAARTEGR